MINSIKVWSQLAAGKKIRHKDWEPHQYIHVVDGELVDEDGHFYDGMFFCSEVELYEDPILNLGPEHVGRKVELRDGTISVIVEYTPHSDRSIRTVAYTHLATGKRDAKKDNARDIVKLLD